MRIINFIERHRIVLSLLLCMLAIVTGGAGVAFADAPLTTPDPAKPVDPVDPTKNNMSSPDGNGAGQELAGTQASATQLKEGQIAQPEYDPDIVHFRCMKYVLLNAARTVAQQRTCNDYEISHFRIGEDKLTGITKQAIAATDGNSITINSDNYDGDLKMLTVGTTILAEGVSGYKDGSTTKQDGELMLYVTAVNASGGAVTARALNGPAVAEGEYDDDLAGMKSPAIPSGTTFVICSIAGAESQQEVAPDNFQPRPKTVYLQKQILNVVFTDHQKKIITKVPWALKDIKASALGKFSKKAEYTLWVGKQKRFKMLVDPTMGEEYVYTSEGALRQISNMMGCSEKITYQEIVAATKIQFSEDSEHNEAMAFCGKDMLEDVINIDWIKNGIKIQQSETEFGVVVRDFTNNFGTLHIVYAPALNDLGYSKFMVIMDMKAARYYTNISKQEKNVDMSQGATGTREASRYIYIEAGALALRGYNSVLVGPSSLIGQRNISEAAKPVTIVTTVLPETPYKGMLIVLTDSAIKVSDTLTLETDKVYEYNGTTWAAYTGTIN